MFFDSLEKKESGFFQRFFSFSLRNRLWRKKLLKAILQLLLLNDIHRQIWIIRYLFLKRKIINIPCYKHFLNSYRRYGTIVGDITPNYATISKNIISAVKNCFPDLKIIFILRDPIQRDWSDAKMHIVADMKTKRIQMSDQLFEKYLRKEFKKSHYLETLSNWKAYYTEDQFHVCFYDELENDPLAFLNNILQFLKIPSQKKTTRI